MDPARFEELTRRTGFEEVIAGILAAKAAGFDPIKINAVAHQGGDRGRRRPARPVRPEHGLELRFIEYMPLDAGDRWERGKVLFAAEILDLLAAGIGPLAPAPTRTRGPRPSITTTSTAAAASA